MGPKRSASGAGLESPSEGRSHKSLRVTLHLSASSLSRFPSGLSSAAAREDGRQSELGADFPSVGEKEEGSVSSTVPTPMSVVDGSASVSVSVTPTTTSAPVGRPRGRPGPKRKMKPNPSLDGTDPVLGAGAGAGGVGTPASSSGRAQAGLSSRPGPKANQGAINAGLRALDRTGKPCRRWERKSVRIRSFTGTEWELETWRAPKRPEEVAAELERERERARARARAQDQGPDQDGDQDQDGDRDGDRDGGEDEGGVEGGKPVTGAVGVGENGLLSGAVSAIAVS